MFKTLVSLVVALLICGVVVAPLAITKGLQIQAMIAAGNSGQPPTTVSATEVQTDEWEQSRKAVGTVTAVNGTTVTTEVSGTVVEIAFTPGTEVSAGDLLVRLEDSVEQANVEQAKAELNLAEKELRRARDLFDRNSVPQSDLDNAEARLAAAKAALAAQQALLAKKHIKAPFAGRLGIRQISLGQFLSPGTPIVDLQSIDPIQVEFSLPQKELDFLREGLTVRAVADGLNEALTGQIEAIAPRVDTATRNVRVQALFDNSEGLLRPGMFVNAEVILPEKREVLMIPQTAVVYNAYGDSVYLVVDGEEGGLVAEQKFIRRGERRGDFVEVAEGLEAGQQIVSQGAFKLRNGGSIAIENEVGTAAPELNPSPPDE
jgi:membrane fusion protein (multidrug efflux system)